MDVPFSLFKMKVARALDLRFDVFFSLFICLMRDIRLGDIEITCGLQEQTMQIHTTVRYTVNQQTLLLGYCTVLTEHQTIIESKFQILPHVC